MFSHLSTLPKVVPKIYQGNLFPNSENNAVIGTEGKKLWYVNTHFIQVPYFLGLYLQ